MLMIESLLSRGLRVVAATCLFGLAAASAFANTVTYDFTYDGAGTYDHAETGIGNGSFTATYTQGSSSGTLDSFSFTDTLTSSVYGDSTFTYSSVNTASLVFSPTSPYGLTNVTIQTPYVTGTNSAFGPVDFVLNYSGVTFDSTGGSNAGASSYLGDFTSGGGTITMAPAVPEPGNVGLLALAALGMGILYRSRSRASAKQV
jgi:hypothetical protein